MVPGWGRAVSLAPLCLEITLCPGHRPKLKELLCSVPKKFLTAHSRSFIINMNFLYRLAFQLIFYLF